MIAFTKKFLAVDVGIPLITSALIVALSFTLLRDIERRAGNIQDFQRTIASRANAVGTLASLRADAERARIYSSVLENILPTKDQLISFPKEFELIASKQHIRLAASFGNERAGTDAEPGAIAFTFKAQGTFPNILAFLSAAESSRYILQWNTFEFLRGKNDDYTAVISGLVFAR